MIIIISVVFALAVIALAASLENRIRVAAPILLVLVGLGMSLVPAMPHIEVEPDWIIAGILPPLLYSASASMPTMDFRREITTISGLAVLLVVATSFTLGLFFWLLIPDLNFALAVALGAIISPTDAVATSIVKKLGVSSRVTTQLDGEGLFNDATALTILRSALVASSAAIGFFSVLGQFLFAVIAAIIIGAVIGGLSLRLRSRVEDPAVNTLISFLVPFAASIPAELLGASGLVAAVVAGLMVSAGAAQWLRPEHRSSDKETWHVIELVFEGAIFFTMGLQLTSVLEGVLEENAGLTLAVWCSIGAVVITLLVRAIYAMFLTYNARKKFEQSSNFKDAATALEHSDDAEEIQAVIVQIRGGRELPQNKKRNHKHKDFENLSERSKQRLYRRRENMIKRIRQLGTSIRYQFERPLTWRHSVVLVWAGMRGAVTLAAAQTIPEGTPQRSLLIFIAFLVALFSLVVQGGTLGLLVRWIKPEGDDPALREKEQAALRKLTHDIVEKLTSSEESAQLSRLEVIHAQRQALLEAREIGSYSSAVLTEELERLDAFEISFNLSEKRE
ncbi:MAG: sodium:proton antiporter [Rothia sp. (in: high G+C Gram-positive bacteria)]|nr:sodium:proton antiporter [Rothia sp. (in: high G+C Gram-positive bacteria)]